MSGPSLYNAILYNNMEQFLHLLSQPVVDLNYDNEGDTPLLESLRQDNSVMAKGLIEAGCDVNLKNPLHYVIRKMHSRPQYRSLAQMLIQKGANINKNSPYSGTPLHVAIKNKNLEAVSMLLYYGADVNITDGENTTPLMYLLSFTNYHEEGIYEVLINYYDDFSCRGDYCGITAIHFAAQHQLRFTIDLFNRGACINCVDNKGNSVLHYTLWTKNAELFKFVWSKIDHNILVACGKPFLETYLKFCRFSQSEYFECLYLMLESPIAPFLIEHYRNRPSWKNNYKLYDKIQELSLYYKRQDIYVQLMFFFLSLDIEMTMQDLKHAYEFYKCDQKFEALICTVNVNCYDYTEQIRYCKNLERDDFYIKGFSWLPFENKQHLINTIKEEGIMEHKDNDFLEFYFYSLCDRVYPRGVLEALNKVPEFPSLFELSRNAAQKFIQENFKVTKFYQFYDAVKSLKLPQTMKDIILLEEPIYK